jgi:hypothetical protein
MMRAIRSLLTIGFLAISASANVFRSAAEAEAARSLLHQNGAQSSTSPSAPSTKSKLKGVKLPGLKGSKAKGLKGSKGSKGNLIPTISTAPSYSRTFVFERLSLLIIFT